MSRGSAGLAEQAIDPVLARSRGMPPTRVATVGTPARHRLRRTVSGKLSYREQTTIDPRLPAQLGQRAPCWAVGQATRIRPAAAVGSRPGDVGLDRPGVGRPRRRSPRSGPTKRSRASGRRRATSANASIIRSPPLWRSNRPTKRTVSDRRRRAASGPSAGTIAVGGGDHLGPLQRAGRNRPSSAPGRRATAR